MISKLFKLTIIFFAVGLIAGSIPALAAKKGTISAKHCVKKGTVYADVAGYIAPGVRSGYIINGKKAYRGKMIMTSTRRTSVFQFSNVPKRLSFKARLVFVTKDKTYTELFKKATKRSKGKFNKC